MGQYALIIAAFGLLGGSALLFGVIRDTGDVGNELTLHQAHWSSRELAVTGLKLTVERLARDSHVGWSGTAYAISLTEKGSGSFLTIIRPINSDTIDVIAEGRQGYFTKTGVWRDTVSIIEARFERSTKDGGDPPAFRNAITTGGNLDLNGAASITSYLPGVSADIHTNGVLSTDGNRYSVLGYGTYVGGEDVKHDGFSAPGGDPSTLDYSEGEYIDIRTIDIDQVLNQPGARIVPPELLTGGVLSFGSAGNEIISITEWAAANGLGEGLGTPTMPLFLLVPDGNILFENRVDIGGWANFIAYSTDPENTAVGNIEVKTTGTGEGVYGGIHTTTDGDGNITTAENMLGLMTTGSFSVKGNGTIVATIFCEQFVSTAGTPTIMGSIVTNSTFDGRGTPSVVYVGASRRIYGPAFDFRIPVGPVLIAYGEW